MYSEVKCEHSIKREMHTLKLETSINPKVDKMKKTDGILMDIDVRIILYDNNINTSTFKVSADLIYFDLV